LIIFAFGRKFSFSWVYRKWCWYFHLKKWRNSYWRYCDKNNRFEKKEVIDIRRWSL